MTTITLPGETVYIEDTLFCDSLGHVYRARLSEKDGKIITYRKASLTTLGRKVGRKQLLELKIYEQEEARKRRSSQKKPRTASTLVTQRISR